VAGEGSDPPVAGTVTLAELGERGLIARLRRRPGPARPEVLVPLGDDAAAIDWDGRVLLATTDTLIEDVHFRRTTVTLRDVGAKAMAVNVSDIAAMGGEPRYALLALALPPTLTVADVDALYDGLEDVGGRYGVTVVGGDTCAAPGGIVLTVTLLGAVDGAPLRRSGARPGDLVLVTGTLGASAAGLEVLEHGRAGVPAEAAETVVRAHRLPVPRVAEGRLVHELGGATAMIDVSDGLATDLGHIARESGVGAVVRLGAVPVDAATRAVAAARGADPTRWALSGGEDYELLFTVVPGRAAGIAAAVTARTGTSVHVIGEITSPGAGVRFVDAAGTALPVEPGFEHFV